MNSKITLPLFGPLEAAGFRERHDSCPVGGSGTGLEAQMAPEHDVASEFIFKTLVAKPAVRELGGISFMTATTWRATVKDS